LPRAFIMSQEFFTLFERLVPKSGQADTVQGELVRAIGRMSDEYFRNGFGNWDVGYERLAAFALRHLTDGTFGPQTTTGIATDIDRIQAYARHEDIGGFDLDAAFDRLLGATAEWCKRHPDIISRSLDPELKR
jgi:hypothetical protein